MTPPPLHLLPQTVPWLENESSPIGIGRPQSAGNETVIGMAAILGYARVSIIGQDIDAQLVAVAAARRRNASAVSVGARIRSEGSHAGAGTPR